MRKVLLLNASEEVIKVIDWIRAVQLYVSGRATKPYNYENSYQILTTSGIFHLPSALMLNDYVRIPRNKLRPSKRNLITRDEKKCQYCSCHLNDVNLTIDHILPKSRGGKNSWENMVCCCLSCNRKKGNKTSQEAKMPLLKPPKPVYTIGCNPETLHENEIKLWQRWVMI
jgi:5-methylcytosine-specific restriction endonuclease McrA